MSAIDAAPISPISGHSTAPWVSAAKGSWRAIPDRRVHQFRCVCRSIRRDSLSEPAFAVYSFL